MDTPQKSVAAVTALAIAISEGKSKGDLIYISEMLSLLSHALRAITIAMIDLDKHDHD